MKKFLLVMLAGVLAVGLSAFTKNSGDSQTSYYMPRAGGWDVLTPAQACTPGSQAPCVLDNPFTPANDPTNVYTDDVLDDSYLLIRN